MYVSTIPVVFGTCVQSHAAVHSPLMHHTHCTFSATYGGASPTHSRYMAPVDHDNWQQGRTYMGPGVCRVDPFNSVWFARKVSCVHRHDLPGSRSGAVWCHVGAPTGASTQALYAPMHAGYVVGICVRTLYTVSYLGTCLTTAVHASTLLGVFRAYPDCHIEPANAGAAS